MTTTPMYDLPADRIRLLRDLRPDIPFRDVWMIGAHDGCWRRFWADAAAGVPARKAANLAANIPKNER